MGCSAPQSPQPDADNLAARVRTIADDYLHGYLEAFPYQALALEPEVHPDQPGDHTYPAIVARQNHEDRFRRPDVDRRRPSRRPP